MNEMYLNTRKLTLNGAVLLATAARNTAEKHKVNGAVAIVDDGGNLVYLERWDNTMIAATKIAIDKACTAVGFRRPTIKIEEVILAGRTPMLSLSNTVDYAPLKGGYPVMVDDDIIGGIAIAGTLSADMDEIIALAAIEAFNQELTRVQSDNG